MSHMARPICSLAHRFFVLKNVVAVELKDWLERGIGFGLLKSQQREMNTFEELTSLPVLNDITYSVDALQLPLRLWAAQSLAYHRPVSTTTMPQ